jgi:hypothetical protein
MSMGIFKNSLMAISAVSVLMSCSSQQELVTAQSYFLPGPSNEKNIDRSPATLKIAPLDRALRNAPVPDSLAVPYAPPGTTHSGSTPAPAPKPNSPEAAGGCPVPLHKIPVKGFQNQFGQSGNVMDLLIGASRRTITGDEDFDRSIMASYFGRNVGMGGEIDQALGHSKAWCRAVQFVRGYTSNQCGPTTASGDVINMQMAAVLTAILVVRNQPECINLVREQAKKILPKHSGEIDEAVLPLTAAAGYLRDNRLQEKFDEVLNNRAVIEKDIEKVDRSLADKEKRLKREVKNSQKQLVRDFRSLINRMNDIPQCKSSVRFVVRRILPGGDPATTTAQDLVDDCKNRLELRLEKLADREQELQDRYNGFVESRSGSENSVASESERNAEDDLEEVRKKIDTVQGYLTLLTDDEKPSSVAFLHEKVNTTYARGEAALKSYETKEYAKEDLQTIKTLEQRYHSYSSQYLTLGFFGPLSGLPQR